MLRKRKETKEPVNPLGEQQLIEGVSTENPLTEQKPMEINLKKQRLSAKKSTLHKIANKFVTYGGYIPELDMVLNDGYYFKTYLLDKKNREKMLLEGAFNEMMVSDKETANSQPGKVSGDSFLKLILRYPELKIQLIASGRHIYGVLGIKAGTPEEALELFSQFEQGFPYPAVSCEEWFSIMTGRLRFESFCGMPQGKKARRTTTISLIQPYDVRIRQKDMELSGKMVKTLILMGYPSKLFPAFATELLEIADNLTLVVFAEQIDSKKCLDGVNLSQDIRPARKEAMKDFLKQAIKRGTKLYNTCAFVMAEGLPGEVEETIQLLKLFCRKYLISASELDYQQGEAYRSTLPLLKNHIRYHRVLTEENVKALLPWSELKKCKKNIHYGEDVISGEVKYDRRIHQENGFILSSDYSWALTQARKEIQGYCAAWVDMNENEKIEKEEIFVLAGEGTEISMFAEGGKGIKEKIQLSYDEAPLWLIRAAIIRWAVNGLSTNGRVMKQHLEMVLKAAEALEAEKIEMGLAGEKINLWNQENGGRLSIGKAEKLKEKFLSQMGENERRALAIRLFITEYEYLLFSTTYGKVYQVKGSGIQAELAYALLFYCMHGIIYSLNSELLAWNTAELFQLHKDSLYTFLTQDNRVFYESRRFANLLKDADFLLIGEHRIFEKLKLSALVGLDKNQREWIAEPAKGVLLMTRQVTYQMKREEESNG